MFNIHYGDGIGYSNNMSKLLPVPTPTLHYGLRNRNMMLSVQKIIYFGLVVIEIDGKPFSYGPISFFFSFFLLYL